MIVHLPMFTISFPANASIFFNMLMTLVSFNVIQVDMILPFLNFTKTEPYNDNFDNMDIFLKKLYCY
jgi:hypothetical protein